MTTSITIRDQTIAGEQTGTLVLDLLTERITARELIRSRVYQEVQDDNIRVPELSRRPDQTAGAGRELDGDTLHRRRPLDWNEQYQRALEAFERNGFFILVDDRQIENLDEEIVLRANAQVSFVRLVPLVGG